MPSLTQENVQTDIIILSLIIRVDSIYGTDSMCSTDADTDTGEGLDWCKTSLSHSLPDPSSSPTSGPTDDESDSASSGGIGRSTLYIVIGTMYIYYIIHCNYTLAFKVVLDVL